MSGIAYSGNRILMTIDDEPASLKSFEGGPAKAELVTMQHGPMKKPMYTIGTLNTPPIKYELGFSQRAKMLEWLNAFVDNNHQYKDGRLDWGDANNNSMGALEFRRALMTELTFPAWDGASKDAAYITCAAQPTEVALLEGDGSKLGGVTDVNQKLATCANFRVTISGLEETCKQITKIDSLSFKMKTKPVPVGEQRVPEIVATVLEMPQLGINFSRHVMAPLAKKYEEFVTKGKVGAGAEMNGSIEILDQSMQQVLFTIEMTGMGFTELTIPKFEANKDDYAQGAAKFYVGDFSFK